MNAYLLPMTCPKCGGGLDPVAEGRPCGGTAVGAVARCAPCHADWHVEVTVRRVPSLAAQRMAKHRERVSA